VFLSLALAAAICVFLLPVRAWQIAAPWLFLLGVALLIAVLVPGIGREVNGARRWLNVPVISIQPSEIVKLAAVLYAADADGGAVPRPEVLRALAALQERGLAVRLGRGRYDFVEPMFGEYVRRLDEGLMSPGTLPAR